jgi:magnesium transporter
VAEWIDLRDPGEGELRRALPCEIHETALELLLQPTRHDDEPRPRLEGHDHYVFGVFLIPIAVREEDRVYYQELEIVATRERVVTVRKTPARGHACDLGPAHEAFDRSQDPRAGLIVHEIVDLIAEDFLDLVDALNDEIDELEDGIESWTAQQVRQRISDLRHDLLHVRRTLAPTRDAVRRVVDRRLDVGEGPELLPRDLEIAFGDVYDKLLRAVDGLDLSRDLLASARDYHQSKIANEQNEVMKRLTVVAALLLLPTFIVGLYGQNFKHIPELSWRFGYWWSWGLILATTALQLVLFRWAGWIGGAPLGRPKLPPLRKLDPLALRGRRRRAAARDAA